jgi:hypothetical protein
MSNEDWSSSQTSKAQMQQTIICNSAVKLTARGPHPVKLPLANWPARLVFDLLLVTTISFLFFVLKVSKVIAALISSAVGVNVACAIRFKAVQ